MRRAVTKTVFPGRHPRPRLEEFEPRNAPNNLLGLVGGALSQFTSHDVSIAPETAPVAEAPAPGAAQDGDAAAAESGWLIADTPSTGGVLGAPDSAPIPQSDFPEGPSALEPLEQLSPGSSDAATAWPLNAGRAVTASAEGMPIAAPVSADGAAHISPGAPALAATPPVAARNLSNAAADRLASLGGASARTIPAPPPIQPAAAAVAKPAVPTAGPAAGTAPDPKLFIPQNLTVNPGATVTVPLQMLVTEPSGILVSEVDTAVAYDTTKFTVSNARLGSMLSPSTFDVTYFDTTSFPGEILMSAASSISQQGFANGAQGAVFLVDFTAKSTAVAGPSAVNLQAQFDEGFGLVQPTDVLDNNLMPLTLTPAPTNAANDPVDGILTVNGPTKTATTTSLAAAPNPSTYGQSVTLTAAVTGAGGTPTGTVTFMDGTTKLGTATLTNGTAMLTTTKLKAGSHSLTAVYGGDAKFSGSTSPAVAQTVNKAATTNKLTVSPTSAVFGQSVTLTATVAVVAPGGGIPGGTVTFKSGTTTVGSARLNASGVATLVTTALPVGTDSLTAVWFGDSNYVGSTSAAVTAVVAKDASTVALTSSQNPSTLGQSVTFMASVAAAAPGSGVPTGTVTFKNGSVVLGTATLSGGTCTFATSALPAGTDNITAVYGGDGHFLTQTSAALGQVVQG